VQLVRLNLELKEYQGESSDIAFYKCLEAKGILDDTGKDCYPFIIEDTSLCLNALNGMPGPYIKDFMKAIGCDGIYKLLNGFDNKKATAQCLISYFDKNMITPITFCGKVDGIIVSPRGSTNFGWDPIFQPIDAKNIKQQTFAEMDIELKNSISHRYDAFNQLNKFLS
jgi:inosine triphosphate pyrophosphatase